MVEGYMWGRERQKEREMLEYVTLQITDVFAEVCSHNHAVLCIHNFILILYTLWETIVGYPRLTVRNWNRGNGSYNI